MIKSIANELSRGGGGSYLQTDDITVVENNMQNIDLGASSHESRAIGGALPFT